MIVESMPVGALQCNCVIVADEQTRQAIVIDPGDDVERIKALLDKHNLSVKTIVATHGHIDHVGGIARLKELTGAKAMLHEADVPMYENLAIQAQWLGVEPPPTTALDTYLTDAQSLEFGKQQIEVRHTPGHSPGSVSFVVPHDVPIVFAGDTLFAGSIGRTDLWGGSLDQILRSIRDSLLVLP
ncbi:MAG: MBL fold metallo-hydrolase, partial [Candidatus Eremiobacteraeota bacterium]|nr:MBL fold metallo-hydrolase [Candidatus Eremiobacteraeota bacterium]